MVRTTSEARQCWCPFARVVNSLYDRQATEDMGDPVITPAHNRHIVTVEDDRCGEMASDYPAMKCIADHCMGWRWSAEATFDGSDVLGYCGLAGKP